jgi:hypothetical protein
MPSQHTRQDALNSLSFATLYLSLAISTPPKVERGTFNFVYYYFHCALRKTYDRIAANINMYAPTISGARRAAFATSHPLPLPPVLLLPHPTLL